MDARRTASLKYVAAILGILTAVVLATLSFSAQPSVLPRSVVVAPTGASWALTPPSTWCNVTHFAGGEQISCSMSGAAGIALNVTAPSRLVGTLAVNGPYTIWIQPSAYGCELEIHLTGFFHPCPSPVNPPPWSSWNTGLLPAGSTDLSTLPLNFTSSTGVLPPAYWALYVVDGQSQNETVSVLTPIVLETQ